MATWKVGADRSLSLNQTASWDGAAAQKSIFDWAGGDSFDPAKARRGFLVYDADAADQRGSYKLPFATVQNGTLTAILAGVNAAASRLSQTDIPSSVQDSAQAVIDYYQGKAGKSRTRRVQYRTADLQASDDGAGFSGYAAHFDNVDSYGTSMQKGAFRKTIKERGDRIAVLDQHNPDWPIGKVTTLKEDKTGLYFDAAISEGSTHGRDAMALLRDGVPLGMSFGFETIKSRPVAEDDTLDYSTAPAYFTSKEGKQQVQVIEEVRLWEVSLVTFPANELATINDVRTQAEVDALTTLLDAIKAGALTSAQRALCADLVAAFSAVEPEPDLSTPLAAEIARRKTRDVQAALALAAHKGLIPYGVSR